MPSRKNPRKAYDARGPRMKESEKLCPDEESVLVSLQLQSTGDFGTLVLRGNMLLVKGDEENNAITQNSRRKLISRLRNIEKWEKKHFPHYTPRICLELFKLLGEGKPENKPFTVKEIVLATGFSERAVRGQLSRFHAHKWIERRKNEEDRRNSHIQPTETLKLAYQNWLSLHLTP